MENRWLGPGSRNKQIGHGDSKNERNSDTGEKTNKGQVELISNQKGRENNKDRK